MTPESTAGVTEGPALSAEALLATAKASIEQARINLAYTRVNAPISGRIGRSAVTPGALVSEQYLLDLEREAFLSLCGERKTLERIAFTLKTGKPLRN